MRTDFRGRLSAVLAGILAMTLAACLDPVDPTRVEVAEVRVVFGVADSADTVQVRGTTRARAVALAREGYDLGRTDFTFSSSDTTIATVDATGVVRGVRAGTATVTATLPDGRSGEGSVQVVSSTIAYTIPVGSSPGMMAFSTDYTRLFVTIAPDSLAIVDALGFFRLLAVPLALPGRSVAATAEAVYVTHPDQDSVSVISTGTSTLTNRIWVGAGPTGAAATSARVFIAARYDRKIVILEPGRPALGLPVGGEPHEVAVSRDGRRLFATVEAGGAWRLMVAAPAFPDTLQSLGLAARPGAIATTASGDRVVVLFPDAGRVAIFTEGADGRYVETGTVDVGTSAGGVSIRLAGAALAIASGAPLTLFDAATAQVSERIPEVGAGHVAIRPDGLFAFIGSPSGGVLRVIVL